MHPLTHRRAIFLLAILVLLPGAPARAQLASDRLGLLPTEVESGPGTIRLLGMGGFRIAVADENQEMNILDFSENPAGFGDDRDAWSMELRYGHKELVERDAAISSGTDAWINDGSLIMGYHAPGRFGLGGRIDYGELDASDPRVRNAFTLAGLQLLGNYYLTQRVSLGARYDYGSEEDQIFSNDIYNINHNASTNRGALGLGVTVAPGIVVGGLAEVVSTSIDGESRGPYHTDSFTWDRPGWSWSLHGAVNRNRLSLAVDHTDESLEGEETVTVSWSRRFVFNPTNERYATTQRTFSETRDRSVTRARARVELTPQLDVSGGIVLGDETADVLANPNFLGSRRTHTQEADLTSILGGASYEMFRGRLLVAAELELLDREVLTAAADSTLRDKEEGWSARLGTEVLLTEVLIGRAGIRHAQSDLFLESYHQFGAPYGHNDQSTAVALGLGVVPSGGIWQLDFSYDVVVKSDIDTDRSRFGAYLKHVF